MSNSHYQSTYLFLIKRHAPWKKIYDKPQQYIKKQNHQFSDQSLYSQSYGFSNSHARLWVLAHKKGWVLKDWCIWIVVLQKTLESSLDHKEIKLVNPKGSQPSIFIGRTDAEAPILWPLDAKNWFIGKGPHVGKDLKAKEEEGDREWDG